MTVENAPHELMSRRAKDLTMIIVSMVFDHLHVPGPMLSASLPLLCLSLKGQSKR